MLLPVPSSNHPFNCLTNFGFIFDKYFNRDAKKISTLMLNDINSYYLAEIIVFLVIFLMKITRIYIGGFLTYIFLFWGMKKATKYIFNIYFR